MVNPEELKKTVNGIKCPVCGVCSDKKAEGIRICHNKKCDVKRFYNSEKVDDFNTVNMPEKKCSKCSKKLEMDHYGRFICVNPSCQVMMHE